MNFVHSFKTNYGSDLTKLHGNNSLFKPSQTQTWKIRWEFTRTNLSDMFQVWRCWCWDRKLRKDRDRTTMPQQKGRTFQAHMGWVAGFQVDKRTPQDRGTQCCRRGRMTLHQKHKKICQGMTSIEWNSDFKYQDANDGNDKVNRLNGKSGQFSEHVASVTRKVTSLWGKLYKVKRCRESGCEVVLIHSKLTQLFKITALVYFQFVVLTKQAVFR